MRLFIAIDLDDAARAAVVAEQTRVADAVRGRGVLQPVKRGHLHLTLAFLGEIPDRSVPELLAVMDAPLSSPRYQMTFAGLGIFPPRGAPTVVWIGVRAGVEETMALQREVAMRLGGAGVVLEDRPFTPHLTLARWRDARPADRRRVLDLDSGCRIAAVAVDAVTIYRSELSGAGATHSVLARAGLR